MARQENPDVEYVDVPSSTKKKVKRKISYLDLGPPLLPLPPRDNNAHLDTNRDLKTKRASNLDASLKTETEEFTGVYI